MRVIIIGCGRVGARVAAELDQRGETVIVVDVTARAFGRLPTTFGGETVRGNGTDEAGSLGSEAAGWPFLGQFVAHDITADRSALRVRGAAGDV